VEVNGKRRPIKVVTSKSESGFDSRPHTIRMKTPALTPFLESVGRVVHHLNTVVVGLSGVEQRLCTKPDSMDITWEPVDLVNSSRGARRFSLESAIVFVAEELSSYVKSAGGVLSVCDATYIPPSDRAQRFESFGSKLGIEDADLVLGPLLLTHWRNRIIHRQSKAALNKSQRKEFLENSEMFRTKYKNLNPDLTLEHFVTRRPTLKDVSSLVAMTINAVKEMDARVPEPVNSEQVMAWLSHLQLTDDFERVKKTPAANKSKAIENFFTTHCPSLKPSFDKYCDESA